MKPRFKMMDEVRLSPLGRIFAKGIHEWPTEGAFVVLGREGSATRPWNYLIENVKYPYHDILWVPEPWLDRV